MSESEKLISDNNNNNNNNTIDHPNNNYYYEKDDDDDNNNNNNNNENKDIENSNQENYNSNNNRIMSSTPPSEAVIQLTSPDGYYTYLGIPKPNPALPEKTSTSSSSSNSTSAGTVDEDLIKKNYRKLSLKHHPDKKGGDAETFRMLNRAQKVLLNPKLRQQYDTLGIDLDDDDDITTTTAHDSSTSQDGKDGEESTAAQGIVHEIAGSALAFLIHLVVRTLMMCFVSVILVRYRLTLLPALLFLVFVGYRVYTISKVSIDLLSPFLLGMGLVLMYYGRNESTNETNEEENYSWCFKFWFGEALVIGMFIFNSIHTTSTTIHLLTRTTIGMISIFSIFLSLFFRGKFWNYVIVISIQALLALFVVLTFPVMEMVLETILNDKLKKVGDKVRAHQKLLNAYYNHKPASPLTTTKAS